MRNSILVETAASLILLAIVSGCAEGPVAADPAVIAKLRDGLILAEEPASPLTPLDWREQAEQSDSPAEDAEAPVEAVDDGSLVLVGQIGGMPNPWPDVAPEFPWRTGEATFFLVDPSTVAEFAAHAGEEGDDHAKDCPFCAREAEKKASSVAAISFIDDAGQPISIDAQQLLGVAAGDMVVVRGKVKSSAGDLLVVEADGLHVRR